MPDLTETMWENCYDENWKGTICAESFAHPAKFSRALIRRIYAYLLDSGYLARGMAVVDPFGGVALGALDAMMNGLHWYGVELEPKFHKLGNDNIDLWRTRWGHADGFGTARLVQGDSRKLCDVLGKGDVILTSPPYQEQVIRRRDAGKDTENSCGRVSGGKHCFDEYGQTDGQLGAMPAGEVDAVVSSSPYNLPMSQDHNGSRGGGRGTTPSEDGAFVKYGSTPGQLEGLPMGDVDAVLSSPPYADAVNANGEGPGMAGNAERRSRIYAGAASEHAAMSREEGYGAADGQLGAMPAGNVADAIVSGPPYEGNTKSDYLLSSDGKTRARDERRGFKQGSGGFRGSEGYGDTEGQLGRERTDTFWSAFRDILLQCHLILKPSGIMVLVCKDFVRARQRVPFSADTIRVAEACGFRLVEWIKASLVKRTVEAGLFGESMETTTERKSFFRRLAERKGSPKIDEEDILLFRKVTP